MAWQLQVVCWPAVVGKSKNNSAWETRSDTAHLHLAELCLEEEISPYETAFFPLSALMGVFHAGRA